MGKKKGLGLFLIIIILIIIIYLLFSLRSSECESDLDCPPTTEKVCRNNSACLITNTFRCNNQSGQSGECAPAGGGIGCSYCQNGCLNGECIPPIEVNGTDLIISNITWSSNTSTSYQDTIFNVTVTVKNIGNMSAEPSNASVEEGSVILAILNTSALIPGEFVDLETIHVLVPSQSTILLTAKADVFDVILESNEENNMKTVSIPF